ncbi:MAG: hypothetical protein IJK54_11595 [Clostridia bacterium]|nr:hypothetical protein [Clostridia bacterium]
MKRIVILCLSLALLLACVPTPEEEFIVNKGDNVTEQQIRNEQTESAQVFPSRWDENETIDCGKIAVSIHADVVQRTDGVYPVYRTRRVIVTQENAAPLLLKLLGTPKSRCRRESTKDDWQREFQAWIDDYNGSQEEARESGELTAEFEAISNAQYEEQAAWYTEQIKNAPISNETEPVSDFTSVPINDLGAVYTMSDGSTAQISIGGDGVGSDYLDVTMGSESGWLCMETAYQNVVQWDPGLKAAWKEPKMQREDAEQMLERELDRLGLSGFSIVNAEKANLMHDRGRNGSDYASVAQGWGFVLRRLYGGYPSIRSEIKPSISLNYESDPAYTEVTIIPDEEIRIMIDESGIRSFRYDAPKEVVGVESANVTLLPFDEVQTRMKNTLRAALSGSWLEQMDVTEIEVYRLLLTCYTVHIRNSEEYYEIPCWVVLFDDPMTRGFRDDPTDTPQALLVNAVDGSIIHTGY